MHGGAPRGAPCVQSGGSSHGRVDYLETGPDVLSLTPAGDAGAARAPRLHRHAEPGGAERRYPPRRAGGGRPRPLLDHESFNVLGRWEVDRGPQYLAYDFWWHLGYDTMITSEWGTPNMVESGLNPELLLAGKYGHSLHIWDLRKRRHVQQIDLGAEHQIVLELRPAHDPTKAYGFAGVVISLKDLSSSIWLWHRTDGSGSNGNGNAKGSNGAGGW